LPTRLRATDPPHTHTGLPRPTSAPFAKDSRSRCPTTGTSAQRPPLRRLQRDWTQPSASRYAEGQPPHKINAIDSKPSKSGSDAPRTRAAGAEIPASLLQVLGQGCEVGDFCVGAPHLPSMAHQLPQQMTAERRGKRRKAEVVGSLPASPVRPRRQPRSGSRRPVGPSDTQGGGAGRNAPRERWRQVWAVKARGSRPGRPPTVRGGSSSARDKEPATSPRRTSGATPLFRVTFPRMTSGRRRGLWATGIPRSQRPMGKTETSIPAATQEKTLAVWIWGDALPGSIKKAACPQVCK
jgi:hypothetical protein